MKIERRVSKVIMIMRDRIQFFSTYDMSISHYLQQAEEVIAKYSSGWRPNEINDVIELYNIWQFVDHGIYMKDWSDRTLQEIRGYKEPIIRFFTDIDREIWPDTYKQIEHGYRHCFWEIIDQFNITGFMTLESVKAAISENDYELIDILRRERLVRKHDKIVAQLLLENEKTAEWLLTEFVEENNLGEREHLFFPTSLTLKDREKIISDYLDTEEPNLNYVRLVIVAKKDANLRLSDEVVLKAMTVERQLNEKYFNKETGVRFKYSVRISEELGKPLKWVDRDDEGEPVLCYSKAIMLQFKGADLLRYCRYGFEFLTRDGMVTLISKLSDSGAFERAISMQGRYSYPINMAFRYHEAISRLQMEAMQNVLESDGRCIETAIKDYYEKYLKEQYGYPSTKLSLLDNSDDWVLKCRMIAPEIDAIAKRYDQYAQRGSVNEALLQISSEQVRITGARSCNRVRYFTIKDRPGELYHLFHLLFSDQSLLSFVDPFKDKHYESFYHLLLEQEGNVQYNNYAQYQQRDIDYLIDEGYLSKDANGILFVEKKMEIGLLRHLYEYHSCPVKAYGVYGQEILQEMAGKGWVEADKYLLSKEERNYFDYYMYNTPYTNGPALRNLYMHGANANPDNVNAHKSAYFRLLVLLILELLKIEDDLITKQTNPEADEIADDHGLINGNVFVLGKVSEVMTFSNPKALSAGGKHVLLPKKLGFEEGYVLVNTMVSSMAPVYVVKPNNLVIAEYLSLLMNSMLFRVYLNNDGSKSSMLTIERIKTLKLPYCQLEVQKTLGELEHLIAHLKVKEMALTREERLQLNLFSNLRDYLCLELYQPDFKDQTGIEFIALYLKVMQSTSGDEDQRAQQLVDILLKPGNTLMDNMKKARIVLSNNNEG